MRLCRLCLEYDLSHGNRLNALFWTFRTGCVPADLEENELERASAQ
jgi:hypothetical protein